jgi:CRISPR-associated protein Cas2
MTVLVANDTPPAIRGLLKRWFIEPRPNVFVGTVNRKTRDKTLAYVLRNAPGLGLLMIASERNCQGFEIRTWGDTNRRLIDFNGVQLIAEDWDGRDEDAGEDAADQPSGEALSDLPPF